MRLYLLGLCIFIAFFASLEARGGKHAWRLKKMKHLSKLSKLKDGGVGDLDPSMKKSFLGRPPIPGEGFYPRKFGRKMVKDKYLKKKHADKKHHKKMSWLKIKSEDNCDMQCKDGQVCISGPIDKRPICVDKKDLKKSVKLFHRYHKKEMKSWRKFQKKNYKKDSKWLKKQDKLERKKNRHIAALKKHHMKKHGYGDLLKKKDDFESDMKKKEFEKHHMKKHGHDDYLKKKYDFESDMKKKEFKKHHMKKHGYDDYMKKKDDLGSDMKKKEFEKHHMKKHSHDEYLKKKDDFESDMEKKEFEKHMKNFDHEKSVKEPSHDFKDSMKELDFKYPKGEKDLKKSMKEDDFKNSMKEIDLKQSVQEGGYADPEEDLDSKELIGEKEKDSEKMELMGSTPALIANTPTESTGKGVCTPDEFVQMRTRMMGWFHLLHGQDRLARKAHVGGIKKFYKHVSVKKELREHDGVKCGCLKSAMWEFHQLDKNDDDHLTHDELAMLEENSLEPCTRPYLDSCDRSGDKKLSSDEWCCCFSHILAPCFMKVDAIKKAKDKNAFIPRCDREGYYMREQCRSDANDKLFCWCVDINGNELKGTATNGRAHCSKLAKRTFLETSLI